MSYPTTYEEAVLFEEEVERLVTLNQANSAKERSPETLAAVHNVQAMIPLGRYRHFKKHDDGSPKEYDVTAVLEDVNTGGFFVEYASHYGPYEGEKALRALTGPDSFLRPIDRAGYRGVRFQYLG
jgi:hypothetical protein